MNLILEPSLVSNLYDIPENQSFSHTQEHIAP